MQKSSADWDDLAAVLAVARARSVRAAAEALGVAHTTLARRVEAAETALGATAFVRSTRGLALTEAGQAIVAHAARMAEEAEALNRSIAGGDHAPSGMVRVTMPPAIVTFVLAPALSRFREQYPLIGLDLDARHGLSDLDRHDADIAIRFQEHPQEHLVGTRIGVMHECAYATPAIAADPANAGLIAWSRAEVFRQRARTFGLGGFRINTTCADLHGQLALAEAGQGIAILPTLVGDSSSAIVRLAPAKALPVQPIWILTHPDLRRSIRVSAVTGFLAKELRAALAQRQGLAVDAQDAFLTHQYNALHDELHLRGFPPARE